MTTSKMTLAVSATTVAAPSAVASATTATSTSGPAKTKSPAPAANGTPPFRVVASWKVDDLTLALAAGPDAIYRLSDVEVAGGDLDGSGIVLSWLDLATGRVLARRPLPGVAYLVVAGGDLWATVRPATDRPSQLIKLDPRSLAVVRDLAPPSYDGISPDHGDLGPPVAAGGWLWTTYGRHYLAYDPTDGRLALDIPAPSGLVAGSVGASGDGTKVWTAAFNQWTPVVPVEERDARTGRVLARGTINAHTFVAAGDDEWTAMTGGMSSLLARIVVDAQTLRTIPDGRFDLPDLQVAGEDHVLWVTAVHTIACADATTDAHRLQLWSTTTWYDDPTPLGGGRLLVVRGDGGLDPTLLTVEPDPRCRA